MRVVGVHSLPFKKPEEELREAHVFQAYMLGFVGAGAIMLVIHWAGSSYPSLKDSVVCNTNLQGGQLILRLPLYLL